VKNHPVKEQPHDSVGTAILSKSPKLEANFSRAAAALSRAQAKKVKRFLPNPERHWGPKIRAGRKITSKHASLLGPDVVNRVINGAASTEDEKVAEPNNPTTETGGDATNEEDEPSTKRQKKRRCWIGNRTLIVTEPEHVSLSPLNSSMFVMLHFS
uniref:Uncharacterized protein n=1 Tax=Oryza glaberrima TaxID=4538 RepID=I1QES6_ORYGL